MEIAVIEKEIKDIVSTAKSIVVTSNDEETFAVEFLKTIKRGQKIVGDEFDENIKNAHATHKGLTAQRKKYLDPLQEAEEVIKDNIKEYRLHLEKIRQEEEAIQKKIIDDQVRAEQERLMAEAQKASDSGDTKKADQLAKESVSIESGGTFVPSKAVKQDGMSSKIVWKARVTDIQMLPMRFWNITANQKMIDDHVKLFGKDNPLTGVEYYQDVSLSVRA